MIRRVKRGFRWLLTAKLLLVAAFVLLAIYTNVPTRPTSEDQTVFNGFGLGLDLDLEVVQPMRGD